MSQSEAPVLDFLGREIKAGNTIVYPVRRGSKMWVQRLKVTQVISGTKVTLMGFNGEGRRITLHNVGNVTVVQPLDEK